MISASTKSAVIARLEHGDMPGQLAEEFGIPTKLVEEWQETLGADSLVAIESNVYAVEKVLHGEVMPMQNDQLKYSLEKTALELSSKIYRAREDDLPAAMALERLAKSVAILYGALINKTDPSTSPGHLSSTSLSAFGQLAKD